MRLLVLLLLVATILGVAPPAYAQTPAAPDELRLPVASEPDGSAVEIDVSRYSPSGPGPHPALILTHGFGGSKADVDDQARDFAADGYLVFAYSARGFGRSGGRIHLNDPDFEVADLRTVIDRAAADPVAMLDGPGDPRLGVTGASYGGAIALLGAAADPRIDALAPIATWAELGPALFPNHAVGEPRPGPMQQQWIAGFFGAALAPVPLVDGEPVAPAAGNPACGRFDPQLCRRLLASAETGRPDDALWDELARRSPLTVADRITAPTLLLQGLADSLFGADHADATAQALQRQGVAYAVHWTDGGHDAEASDPDADRAAVALWFAQHLRGEPARVPAFSYPGPRPLGDERADRFAADAYPGLTGGAPMTLPIAAEPQTLANPPGGQPASITRTGVFGRDDTGNPFQAYPLAALPGQSAAFDTDPVTGRHPVVGSPTVRLRVTSSAAEATVFVSLWQVNGATAAQPRRGVAPVRIPVTPGEETEVTVALPAGTWVFEPSSTWRVLVTSTDSAYANATVGRLDQIDVVALDVPGFAATPSALERVVDAELLGVLLALAAAILVLAGWGLAHHRARARLPRRADLERTPVAVENLSKVYPDGHRAVSGVTWRAEPGQVVGLLGPNGAGKTTTLRMALGLITPDSGGVWVLGRPVTPGAAILRNVGALVEGPGFLPHLTGRQNLDAYWAATGRPHAESGMAEAVDVAALGGALDRPVKTYSQGMRQRLGIAQAMLGRPDLLILDEPTNGLDPPQIAALRPILRAYAATGRTVVVSSHLLAEVEQTCTHVVVMDAGRVLVSGPVTDLLESHDTSVLVTAHPVSAEQLAALRATAGVTDLTAEEDNRLVVEADLPRAEVVGAAVAAGLELVEVSGRRHLEELFLSVIGQGREPAGDSTGTLADRLREVRPR